MKTKFSKIGFILAAAGSAVGLGNIWKFPYITGEYGGGAFVIIYLLAIALIGLTIFIGESYIGKESGVNAAASYQEVAKSQNKNWRWAGFQIFTGIIILSFYAFIIGWVINYIWVSLSGLPSNVDESTAKFTGLLGDKVWTQIFFHTAVMAAIVFIALKGIKEGIERLNLILMPLLGLILLILLIYSISLDSFGKALSFMFIPDWSKVGVEAILAAIGQAFFTLSLGMAIIITYSASMSEDTNIVKSSTYVACVDTIIAIVAGIIVFSFLFSAGAENSAGPGLVFISLPTIFGSWGVFGQIVAVAFFISLLFAGLTSAISIFEPSIRYLTEKFEMPRIKAVFIAGAFAYILGIIALLSMTNSFGESLTFFGKSLFDHLDYITSSIALPIAGFITCIFLGYFVDQDKLKAKITSQSNELIFNIWHVLIRYIVPVFILLVFANKIGII